MQPIILLGVVAVAAALIGTGFLGTGGNIALWVQSLGWGEQDLQAPISHAFIDLNLKKIPNPGPDGQANTGDEYFDNVISSCSFHSDQNIRSADPASELSPGLIICKLTDDRDKAIAEGRILLNGEADPDCPQTESTVGYDASQHLNIDICQTAFPGANDVQKVTDVKIVVEGALDRSMGQ
jgi:hypothetical protein